MTQAIFCRTAIAAYLGLAFTMNVYASGVGTDSLRFPVDVFTVKTRQVKFGDIEHTVRYRAYEHILYVQRPVSKEFESLDVGVPVEIDGKISPVVLLNLATRHGEHGATM